MAGLNGRIGKNAVNHVKQARKVKQDNVIILHHQCWENRVMDLIQEINDATHIVVQFMEDGLVGQDGHLVLIRVDGEQCPVRGSAIIQYPDMTEGNAEVLPEKMNVVR